MIARGRCNRKYKAMVLLYIVIFTMDFSSHGDILYQEKSYMHFMYSLANGNALEAANCRGRFSREELCQTKRCSSDCIGACVKRVPSFPACKIQDVTGVSGQDNL